MTLKPRVLITGFGPFPGQPQNPSATLVRGLRQVFARGVYDYELRALILETAYDTAWPKLEAALEKWRPDVAICFGVAANAGKLRLERTARNQQSTQHADARNFTPASPLIAPDGPATRESTLPLALLAAQLAQARIDTAHSEDAGAYLCNYVFYNLMTYAAAHAHPLQAGFLHIPAHIDSYDKRAFCRTLQAVAHHRAL